MSLVTILWSTASGACLMLALMHLLVWARDRRSWANLCFSITVLGAVGLSVCEMITMRAASPHSFGMGMRWAHVAISLVTAGSLGFVHFYFGTGKVWLLAAVLCLRLLAVVANFVTGLNLHVAAIQSLQKVPFLGEQVSILGEWTPNPWVRLGQLAALLHIVYVMDASIRLWRQRSPEARRRAAIVGGGLVLFIGLAATQAGLVAAGILRMPFLVSAPFLGVVMAMGYELSRDVLRSAQLTRELRESEQRMALGAEAANQGIWIRDLKRSEIWATDKWRTLFGFEKSEKLELDRILEKVHPEDREMVFQTLERAILGDGSYETEYRLLLPDKSIRWIASQGRVEFDATGKPLLVRGVSTDITPRKTAELEAASQRKELAHLSRVSTLGEFAGALAHELNQPLTAMLSNAQAGQRFLKQDTPDMNEITDILGDITEDAKRAGDIIHGMRAMFRKDVSAEKEPVDLNDVVRQVLSLLHSEIVGRKIRMDLRLAETLPVTNASRVEVQQVLMNLILNGLDAMKAQETPSCLTITTVREEDRIILSVKDNGPGIREDLLERLFEPFVSTKSGGLGLGLAISRSLMERFGGELVGRNDPAGGAVFHMKLPAVEKTK